MCLICMPAPIAYACMHTPSGRPSGMGTAAAAAAWQYTLCCLASCLVSKWRPSGLGKASSLVPALLLMLVLLQLCSSSCCFGVVLRCKAGAKRDRVRKQCKLPALSGQAAYMLATICLRPFLSVTAQCATNSAALACKHRT